jgi:GntR family transcriptional regulator, transcriptional repressor for pyruvate dehydrogenase complex
MPRRVSKKQRVSTRKRAPREDITVRLIASFKDLLSQRVLRPGNRLPPERELAIRFGVSRASLRQALKVLEIMGVISQRVGDGTYVQENAAQIFMHPMELLVLFDSISMAELFEARMMVEPELAARAAERAKSQDLMSLRSALKKMKNAGNTETYIEGDLAFHNAIFEAAGNRVCQRMFSVLQHALHNSMKRTLSAPRKGVRSHNNILKAIQARKPVQARTLMLEHLNFGMSVVKSQSDNVPKVASRIRPLVKM